jgi:DNA-binding MarR family transcriptional regulator
MTVDGDVESGADPHLVASRALVALAARSLADIGEITLPQFRALVVLTRRAPVTVGTLLQRWRSTRRRRRGSVTGSNASGSWVGAGARADRRETTVMLTDKCRRLVARVTERRRRSIAEIAAPMSAADLRNAINGLRAFGEAASEPPIVDPFGWADLASGDEVV